MSAYFNYTVPDGNIAILRGFKYALDPLFGGVALGDITGQLTVGNPAYDNGVSVFTGGASVKGFSAFNFGQIVNNYVPCYVIAAPLQTISLVLRFSGAYALLPVTSLAAQFYGNLLVSTGRPVNYEPGFSEPLPVYDRTEYFKKKERDLITSQEVPALLKPSPVPDRAAYPQRKFWKRGDR